MTAKRKLITAESSANNWTPILIRVHSFTNLARSAVRDRWVRLEYTRNYDGEKGNWARK